MKIKSAELSEYSVPFRESFRRSSGSLTSREGLIVTVRSYDGLVGFGEIAPMQGHSRGTLVAARAFATGLQRIIPERSLPESGGELADFALQLMQESPETAPPSVIFGFETAIADLAAKACGSPLSRWLSPKAAGIVPINALLPGDSIAIRRDAPALRSRGFSTFKIKVGSESIAADVSLVEAARQEFGDDAKIRIDANRAWDFGTALRAIDELRKFSIEYLEEPLRHADLQRLGELHERTEVPIALDESIGETPAWRTLLQTDGIVAAVIKPTVVGGFQRSIELAGEIADFGKKAVITTCFESTVGTAACLHLSAALGVPVLPCGLDTLRFLSDTLSGDDLVIERGSMVVPSAPGLGVEPRLNHER